MKDFAFRILNEIGIHHTPALYISGEARKYRSSITFIGDRTANAKELCSLLRMRALHGHEIRVEVDGPDEETAAVELEEFLRNQFEY